MKISTTQILKILHVISWIIFIGVCIEAGGFIFNALLRLVIDPANAKYLWQEVDLSALYKFDHGYFYVESFHISMVAVLRAYLFYVIVKFLYSKQLNMSHPFNKEVGQFISTLSYIALAIGLFSWWGVEYTAWLAQKGVQMPTIENLRLGGADVWLFMGVTLFVIAQIFKRGIEIQTENELTV